METKYHFFWGGIYSNWHKSPIKTSNDTYNCVEQYMMWMKANLFGDRETMDKIMATSDPRKQKNLGRKVKNFNPEVWDKHKYDIVKFAVLYKFDQNEELKQQLLQEDCDLFVEASPFDRIWGIGYDAHDAGLVPEKNWGENLLGKIITEVRDILKNLE